MRLENSNDPRDVLVRQKFFSIRPKPLEHWIWGASISPSAERVFWIHWEAGHRSGTWCSAIPLRQVARESRLDVSTVTRAYQQLSQCGLIRRQDPGRDPRNPFMQATAITEVRLPRELLCELGRHPNRRASAPGTGNTTPAVPPVASESAPASAAAPPSAGLRISAKERMARLTAIENPMSAGERSRFHESMRTRQTQLTFDDNSALSPEQRGAALQWLINVASQPAKPVEAEVPTGRSDHSAQFAPPRNLSVFDLARVRREILQTVPAEESAEVLRQVVWSMEQGALRRFAPLHAINIALKKVREGQWNRPNRMPPNWLLQARTKPQPEACGTA